MIVDDDIRNIFSLTSVLESHDVEVLHAERGKDGILILEQVPGVDAALIEISAEDSKKLGGSAHAAHRRSQAIVASSNAFCAWRRFSAWSSTIERGPSRTAEVISTSR